MPGGTRLIQNDRADILMSDLGMVDVIISNSPTSFERGFKIVTDYKIAVGLTKNNKDLAQALYDGLVILKANGTQKAIFTKYNVDYGLARAQEILTK
jgi:polar amino acid transport system substrate-binding protein